MERDVQEVKLFILERLRQFILDHIEEEGLEEQVSTARIVLKSIRNEVMLNKEDAKWLEEFIDNELEYRIENEYKHSRNLALFIDELSIYSDAWGLYCRPGTYSI